MNESSKPSGTLTYAPGAHPLRGAAGRRLERKLRKVAKAYGHPVRITSGRRTDYEAWAAYADYLNGGNLAAYCCEKHYRHPWAQCLRHPTSNHCTSRAADVQAQLPWGGWVPIGEIPACRKLLRKYGCCLPVGSGETWHVEEGHTWNS